MQLPKSFGLKPDSRPNFRFALSENHNGDADPVYVDIVPLNSRAMIQVIVFPLDEQAERKLRTEGIQSVIMADN